MHMPQAMVSVKRNKTTVHLIEKSTSQVHNDFIWASLQNMNECIVALSLG